MHGTNGCSLRVSICSVVILQQRSHINRMALYLLHLHCRGLRTALIEREDFGSGTSSKSTKLVHGGVRYLEKAVFNVDYGQLKLVYEALQERRDLLENAPHLTSTLPILMPCYKWWEVPFYFSGLKAYDILALGRNLAWSRYLTPTESHRRLATLAETNHAGKSLKGAVSDAMIESQCSMVHSCVASG